MKGLVESFGAEMSATLLLLIAAAALAQPLLAAFARRRWPRVKARVVEVSTRRSITTGKWSVGISWPREGGGERHKAEIAMNLVRRTLSPGDEIEIRWHPRNPSRIALSPWDGASTGVMVGMLSLLGAVALLRGAGDA